MFSSSFVSSAASGDETRWIGVDRAAVERRGRLGRGLVDAADDLRHVFVVWSVRPGSTRSGEKARWKSTPASRPEPSLEDRQHARRASCPGTSSTRARRDDPRGAACAICAAAPRTIERSGSRWLRERRRQRDQDRVGVAQLVVVGRRAQAALVDERRELSRRDVLDVALARGSAARRARRSTSTSSTERPASANTCASGTPTYPAPTIATSTVARSSALAAARSRHGHGAQSYRPACSSRSPAHREERRDPLGCVAVAVQRRPLGGHPGGARRRRRARPGSSSTRTFAPSSTVSTHSVEGRA